MFPARIAACALLALGGSQLASAADSEGGHWKVGVSGGTLGLSPEVGYRFNRFLGLRANGGFFNYDRSEELDDVDYDGTLKLNSVGLLADWHPFGGSFRISGGARSNGNKVDLVGVLNSNVEIGDEEFTPAQVGALNGTAEFKKLTPTLTLGWGGKFANGFMMGLEAGVMFQGSAKLNMTSTGGTLSSDADFLAELESERAQAEEDISDYKLWPVLQLHFAYRF
jgi:hypothetical protein